MNSHTLEHFCEEDDCDEEALFTHQIALPLRSSSALIHISLCREHLHKGGEYLADCALNLVDQGWEWAEKRAMEIDGEELPDPDAA